MEETKNQTELIEENKEISDIPEEKSTTIIDQEKEAYKKENDLLKEEIENLRNEKEDGENRNKAISSELEKLREKQKEIVDNFEDTSTIDKKEKDKKKADSKPPEIINW